MCCTWIKHSADCRVGKLWRLVWSRNQREAFSPGSLELCLLCVLMMWSYGVSGGRGQKVGHRQKQGTEEANAKHPCCLSDQLQLVALFRWKIGFTAWRTSKTHTHRMETASLRNIKVQIKHENHQLKQMSRKWECRTDRSPCLKWVEVWFMLGEETTSITQTVKSEF